MSPVSVARDTGSLQRSIGSRERFSIGIHQRGCVDPSHEADLSSSLYGRAVRVDTRLKTGAISPRVLSRDGLVRQNSYDAGRGASSLARVGFAALDWGVRKTHVLSVACWRKREQNRDI